MVKRFSIILFICFGLSLASAAQSEKLSTNVARAALMYQRSMQAAKDRNFDKAIELMENAIRRDPKFGEAYLRLGGYMKLLGNKSATYENYKKGIALLPFNPNLANEYLAVADVFFSQGDYKLAQEHYANFIKANHPKLQKYLPYAELQLKNTQFAEYALQHPVDFNPKPMGNNINQFTYQYFPTVTADQRHFLYTGRNAGQESDENLYISQREGDGWSAPVSVSPLINTSYNEGAGTISGDGKTLVFTSCDRPDSQGDCDLYISVRKGDQWSKPRNMGPIVNSSSWDSQPSLSADGRTLYFSSLRRNGSMGQEDIWVTRLQENGQWSGAVNVGAPINTPGKDLAPFVHASGTTLYFTSDGHVGMGGLDVYEVNFENNAWSEPQNLGYPLNTHEDEGSIYISANNTKGYYSRQQTNSGTGKKTIDLFEFEVPMAWKSKEASTYAQGRVFDAITKKPVSGEVQLYDLATDELVQQVSSDPVNGEYTIILKEGSQYAMYASADGYLLKSLNFDYLNKKDFNPLTLDIYLDPVKAGSSIVLNNIFFGSGKYNLEPSSKTELKKLIAFLRRNSNIKVEISGHTDDIGSDQANQELSEKRAQAVADFLSNNGIPRDRIRFIGHGESKPAVPNNSEANRQQNRRIEFRIL